MVREDVLHGGLNQSDTFSSDAFNVDTCSIPGRMPRDGSFAITPDTKGMNFYREDQGFVDLLKLYLEPELHAHLEPHFERLGWLAANDLSDWADIADKHPPILHHRTKFGQDVQHIEYHPAYRKMEHLAFGEFGIHAMSYRAGVLGWDAPLPPIVKYAATYLFNQAEFGLGCPINVTETVAYLLMRHGDRNLQDRFLESILSTDMSVHKQGAVFMTEKEGGTDVAKFTTVARRDGDNWRIFGDKWFCSNADAPIIMTLARPEDENGDSLPGLKGLGLFLIPRDLEDGSRNRLRIVRLKDKLGTRSMASGEVRMEGALAYAVGALDRGFAQMTDQINMSRLSNGVKSAALMRRSLHEAICASLGRHVTGHVVATFPLARRQLLKMMVPTEQALSFWMFTADVMRRADPMLSNGASPSQEAAALLRLLTPLTKFRATRDARKVAGDALEMRGGVGYIEDWVNPRLVRDSHLGSIWEGPSSVIALDVIGRAVKRSSCEDVLQSELHARLGDAPGVPSGFLAELRDTVDRSVEFARKVASLPGDEADSRRASAALYHATTAVLMAWEAAAINKMRGDARRLLFARLVLDHRLKPQDPLASSNVAREDAIASALLGKEAVDLNAAADLIQ